LFQNRSIFVLKETRWKKNNKIPQKADNVASSRFILVIILVLSLTGLMINAPLSTSQVDLIQLEATAEQKEEEVWAAHDQLVNILANDLETRINKSGSILEITGRLPEVTTPPNASSIESELHGIPKI